MASPLSSGSLQEASVRSTYRRVPPTGNRHRADRSSSLERRSVLGRKGFGGLRVHTAPGLQGQGPVEPQVAWLRAGRGGPAPNQPAKCRRGLFGARCSGNSLSLAHHWNSGAETPGITRGKEHTLSAEKEFGKACLQVGSRDPPETTANPGNEKK